MADPRALAALACALLPACIAPSVVASTGRAVEAPEERAPDWREPQAADLEGLWESVAIEGEVAASLSRVWYHFAADGTYSGAALVLAEANPAFQTLSGSWTLRGAALDLGDGTTVRASIAADRLRLESEGGIAVLRRAAVR